MVRRSKRIVIVCIWILAACSSLEHVGHEAASEKLSRDDLANATYKSEWTKSGAAPLSEGIYNEPAAPGSATETRVMLTDDIAYGDLDDRSGAAVVLVTDPGGSGTFFDLAVVVSQSGQAANVATTNLGDRVRINSVTIENDEIIVDMVAHAPNDPLCCPTLRVINRFGLQGDQLVRVTGTAEIIGVSWRWQQTLMNNYDTFVPRDPDKYTLELKPDGKVAVQADCNYGSGTYLTKGSQISMEIMAMTMAACRQGSLSDQYVKDLNAAAGYFIEGDTLYIDLKYDSGTMKFSR